ncbi:unnamed protein product [Ascophyllum nodosum]
MRKDKYSYPTLVFRSTMYKRCAILFRIARVYRTSVHVVCLEVFRTWCERARTFPSSNCDQKAKATDSKIIIGIVQEDVRMRDISDQEENKTAQDLPVGGMDQDTDNRDNSTTYVPQPPPRSHAPAVFKAWRQESYRSTMNQAVVQDDTKTLTWMVDHDLVDLAAVDDMGNTASHLAVFHDSPSVLRLLHRLGVDLSTTCDADGFGSAIFYSVYLGRVECLAELISLGYDMTRPCDRFGRTPTMVAVRHDQGAALYLLRQSFAAVHAQRLVRGFLVRRKAARVSDACEREEKIHLT